MDTCEKCKNVEAKTWTNFGQLCHKCYYKAHAKVLMKSKAFQDLSTMTTPEKAHIFAVILEEMGIEPRWFIKSTLEYDIKWK